LSISRRVRERARRKGILLGKRYFQEGMNGESEMKAGREG
jgi:hypothetical protein